jgi:transposase InsO family protein
MRLSIYDFELHYRQGKSNGNADCLSRLPIVARNQKEDQLEESTFEIKAVSSDSKMNLNLKIIAEETGKNVFLSQIRKYILNGWNLSHVLSKYKSFFQKNALLTVEFGCIVYNGRVVIPESLQTKTLELLHVNHCGIVTMKKLSRTYVYWQGLDKDIENFVKSCSSCQKSKNDNPRKCYGSWPETTFPFERIHLDFFYFQGKQFLILIDCYSRWLEIKYMKNSTAHYLIKELRGIFRRFGPCKICVTDNGPPFNSYDFKKFCTEKKIELLHSPPYHPASNGMVERSVQTVKSVLKKFVLDEKNDGQLFEMIGDFLENYRFTPHTEKNLIPANLMFNFEPRNKLECAFKVEKTPKERKKTDTKVVQKKFKSSRKLITIKNSFGKGDEVWYRNPTSGFVNWHKGKIIEQKSKHVFLISVNGLQKLAHVNQLKQLVSRKEIVSATESEEESLIENELRRSERVRRKPDRFQYERFH